MDNKHRFVTVSDNSGNVWDILALSPEMQTEKNDKSPETSSAEDDTFLKLRCDTKTSKVDFSVNPGDIRNPFYDFVVDFSELRSQNDCIKIQFNPFKHISTIEEVKNEMKICLGIALSSFGMYYQEFANFLISFSPEMVYDGKALKKFIGNNYYMQILLNQLVFDVLYDYHHKNDEKITVNKAACILGEKIYYKIKDNQCYDDVLNIESDGCLPISDTIRKTLKSGAKAENNRTSASLIKNNITSMGIDPNQYTNSFVAKKLPLMSWIFIYINQRRRLVSSVQYRKQLKNDGNNISKDAFIDEIIIYDLFRELYYPSINMSVEKYFNNAMIYYAIESYKRIDFMLYLLSKCESNDSILNDIDNLESSFNIIPQEKEQVMEKHSINKLSSTYLQTSTPAAFLQRHQRKILKIHALYNSTHAVSSYSINSHASQMKSPLFLEKALLDYTVCPNNQQSEMTNHEQAEINPTDTNPTCEYFQYFQRMEAYTLLRNKAYEIFSANYTFGPAGENKSFSKKEYESLKYFIEENYNLRTFHDEIPTWKELYAEADKADNMPVNKGKSSKRKVLPDDSINKLKKRMMILSSYLFPHIEK